jgi:hypothetical protein
MSDQFPIVPPQVTASAGVVSDYVINLAFNQLTLAVRQALNILALGTPPIGPAGGDLSGTYPNPTVAKVHATSGTVDNVVIGGVVPAAGTFTTLSAISLTLTNPLAVAQGGTGVATLAAHAVLLGEGTGNVAAAAPGAAGQMLLSTGATTDPAFGNNPAITGGSINGTPVGSTTPSTGAFTTLSATSTVSGTGFTAFMASPPPLGSTAPNSVAATTLSATSTISGAGFTAFMASPPPLGSTAPSSVAATTLSATGTVSGAGFAARFASPGPIGSTAASTGAFTTITATGTITPSSTNGIVGTATNDNANAGSVGEFISANASAVSVSSGVATNVTSLSLTAGDWDVSGQVVAVPAGTTVLTQFGVGINTTSATLPTAISGFGVSIITGALGTGTNPVVAPMVTRISVASTTTVYLVTTVVFTVSTCTVNGFISARRVR